MMKRFLIVLVFAGVSASACTKESTSPQPTALDQAVKRAIETYEPPQETAFDRDARKALEGWSSPQPELELAIATARKDFPNATGLTLPDGWHLHKKGGGSDIWLIIKEGERQQSVYYTLQKDPWRVVGKRVEDPPPLR
jgi:hypothetical protein